MSESCEECSMHYEMTEEQKENYDGHCGCKSIEECGYCFKTREVEE